MKVNPVSRRTREARSPRIPQDLGGCRWLRGLDLQNATRIRRFAGLTLFLRGFPSFALGIKVQLRESGGRDESTRPHRDVIARIET